MAEDDLAEMKEVAENKFERFDADFSVDCLNH